LIGHGVVMEGNRKMRGCLQTFGGHCIIMNAWVYIKYNYQFLKKTSHFCQGTETFIKCVHYMHINRRFDKNKNQNGVDNVQVSVTV